MLVLIQMTALAQSMPELCNGLDDDLNGIVDDGPVCPIGSFTSPVDGHAYLPLFDEVIQADAATACASYGYHLADLDSVYESGFVEDRLELSVDQPVWLGAQIEADGSVVDSDGDGATHVDFDFSTDPTGPACVYLAYQPAQGARWFSASCVDLYAPLCEADCDRVAWWADEDGDGYGEGFPSFSCGATPMDAALDGGDCDDNDPDRNPGEPERCNTVDDDCDGEADEGLLFTLIWEDADGDGFGAPGTAMEFCTVPDGFVVDNTDCDDADADVNPAADEICNELDDDCDEAIDDNDPSVEPLAWYQDIDQDGAGAGPAAFSCLLPVAASRTNDDCDDFDADVIQPDDPFAADLDGDGFGDATAIVLGCGDTVPPDAVALGGLPDCNDTDAAVNPGEVETCNGVDDDCQGGIDDQLPLILSYADADGDGFGDAMTGEEACSIAPDRVQIVGDCDDTDPEVNPDAIDTPDDGIDQDCDGVLVSVADADGDGVIDRIDSEPDGSAVPVPAAPSPRTWGCTTSAPSAPWLLLPFLGLLVRRRRSDRS